MTAYPQRSLPPFIGRGPPPDGWRVTSQNELLRLTRGWCREQGFDDANARLRAVAPDPLPANSGATLARTLGVRPGAQPEAVINALIAVSAALPSLAERMALREALNAILESLFP